MSELKQKVCTKCKLNKDATLIYFDKNKQNKNGLSSWCKDCRKKHNDNNYQLIKKNNEGNKQERKSLTEKLTVENNKLKDKIKELHKLVKVLKILNTDDSLILKEELN